MSESARDRPDAAVVEPSRRILRKHDVAIAVLFGSAADPDREEWTGRT